MNTLKLFSMFSGYGGSEFALKELNIPFSIVGYSEVDKYAISCYEQNHPNNKNYGDCRTINPKEIPDFDLLTAGFPCQSFSNAGKMKGEADSRGTLFNDIIRIAASKKPKYMLLENVKGLTFKKFESTLNKILTEIQGIGYTTQYQILNSKEYGIPQNRERIWIVCIRKDIQKKFTFPQKKPLKIFLQDLLEKNVEQKYYLTKEQQDKIIYKENTQDNTMLDISQIKREGKPRYYQKISKTLTTAQGGGHVPLIFIKNATKKGYLIAKEGDGINLEQPNSKTRRGRVQEKIIPTLQTNDSRGVIQQNRIRKLTPKECFRLMGFIQDQIKTENLSNTQLYKLAGNGWDINLAKQIIKEMVK